MLMLLQIMDKIILVTINSITVTYTINIAAPQNDNEISRYIKWS